jgi:imidazolonepropionase-like amidohydrolase
MQYVPQTTVIKAKAVIDGISNRPLANASVVIEKTKIKEIIPAGKPVPEGPHVHTLDYSNAYLLPGFIDTHIHLIYGVYGATYEEVMFNDSDDIMLLRAARNAGVHLRCGVTTLRENGARNKVTFNLREGWRRGYLQSPRLYLCGRPVTLTGGHFWWCNQEADGADGVRAAVRALVKDGADHIKIMASGGGTAITDNRKPSYSVEELRAIVDEAHNLGKKTTAHCLATKSLENALDAGVDMIEHAGFLEPDGTYKYYPRIGERIAKQGVYVCPTVQTGYRQREVLLARQAESPLSAADMKRLDGLKAKCESQLEFVGRMWKDGIKIVSGTDAIQIFGEYTLGLELHSEAGMSNMDIIKTSTYEAARCMGIEGLVGAIKPGLEADLLVVDNNPIKDIKALRKMAMVMQAGNIISFDNYPYANHPVEHKGHQPLFNIRS